MFLKQERPETNDFVIQKKSGCEGNFNISSILQVFYKFLADTLTKIAENIFAYSCVSELPKHFFNENLHFLGGQGFRPPP